MKFRLQVGGGELEFEADTLQKIMEQASFYTNLPSHCPVDGTRAVFAFNQADSYKYYSLVSTGDVVYEYKFGIRTDNNALYPKYWPHEAWIMYDAKRDAHVCVWLNGSALPEPYPVIEKPKGKPVRLNGKEIQPPVRRLGIGGDDEGLDEVESEEKLTLSATDVTKDFNALGERLFNTDWPRIREAKRIKIAGVSGQLTKEQMITIIADMKVYEKKQKG